MRILLQRVKEARVEVEGAVVASIGKGLLLFLGIGASDAEADCEYLYEKVTGLRVFDDDHGKMNLSSFDVQAELLVVSQFTLYGDCRKGRRPSFDSAMKPQEANRLYQCFLDGLSSYGLRVVSGQFQALMQVYLVNDGPVTILLDSRSETRS